VSDLNYEAIGCLDGGIAFDKEYFSSLLGKRADDPSPRLVGDPYWSSLNQTYDRRFISRGL
jgi:hypothetical protein